MAKYMIIANYSAEGIKGVLAKGGSSRVEAVTAALKGLGGTLESFYFAFGDADAYVIVDLPDATSAAAVAMQVGSSGLVSARTVVLLAPEDIDEATRMTVGYRPPGS